MNKSIATPAFLKQINLSFIRNTIKERGSVTRAELFDATGISATTIRILIAEMLERGEIVPLGHDDSSGGRKAERYGFNTAKNFGLSFCVGQGGITYAVINVLGDIVEKCQIDSQPEQVLSLLEEVITAQLRQHDIQSIGIGVSGVVEDGRYWQFLPERGRELVDMRALFQKFSIPVVLENDLNAIAIGFSQRHAASEPDFAPECLNMAYLFFDDLCISAGLIANGTVIRGENHFAGELGYLPFTESAGITGISANTIDPDQYAQTVAKTISAVNCVVNPRYVVLGGYGFRREFFDQIRKRCGEYIPAEMMPQILLSDSAERDFLDGMMLLTAEKIFDDIKIG